MITGGNQDHISPHRPWSPQMAPLYSLPTKSNHIKEDESNQSSNRSSMHIIISNQIHLIHTVITIIQQLFILLTLPPQWQKQATAPPLMSDAIPPLSSHYMSMLVQRCPRLGRPPAPLLCTARHVTIAACDVFAIPHTQYKEFIGFIYIPKGFPSSCCREILNALKHVPSNWARGRQVMTSNPIER
jgi:hypothetical protein